MAFTSCHDRGSNQLPPDGRASTLTAQPLRLAFKNTIDVYEGHMQMVGLDAPAKWVTPRYLVVVLKSTFLSPTSNLFGYLIMFLALVKIMQTLLSGLNFNPHECHHLIRSFTTFCVLLIIWSRFVPPIRVQLSSANPKPVTPWVLSICNAWL